MMLFTSIYSFNILMMDDNIMLNHVDRSSIMMTILQFIYVHPIIIPSIWWFPKNRGTPKSSICRWDVPLINHLFWGTPMTVETPISSQIYPCIVIPSSYTIVLPINHRYSSLWSHRSHPPTSRKVSPNGHLRQSCPLGKNRFGPVTGILSIISYLFFFN